MTVLAGLFRKRAATGTNVCEQHSIKFVVRLHASFDRGGSYRFHERTRLDRLKILTASVADGQMEGRCRNGARTRNERHLANLVNSAIPHKIVP